MDKFDRHIGAGKAITIGEDTFLLKPLGVQHMKDFFKIMKKFEGHKKAEEFLKTMDDETSITISGLIMATLRKSYPEISEEKLSEFGMKNFSVIISAVFEMNLGQENQLNPAAELAKKMSNVQGTTG